MKKFLFSTAVVLIFSQSLAFAMLDEDFKGDTLIIGGVSRNNPSKLSINITGGDIQGSGWDEQFLEKFTQGKYKHILYEHVGYSLADCDGNICVDDPENLAKIHFNLLQPGGTFDFLTWGDVFRDELGFTYSAGHLEGYLLKDIQLGMKMGLHFNYIKNCGSSDEWSLVSVNNPFPQMPDYKHPQWRLSNFESGTLFPLACAGFTDIHVEFEKDGVLGFTNTHHSLHISAKKPK